MKSNIENFELGIIWEWNFDCIFNDMVKNLAEKKNLSILFIDPFNFEDINSKINNQAIRIEWFLDRASETDPRFLPLIDSCVKNKIKPLNPPAQVHKALNKALMHKYLFDYNILLPETLIIPSYQKCPALPFFTLEKTGIPFVLKPSNGGGGEGVHLGLTELIQIEHFRKEFPDQDYLIQQTIIPKLLNQEPLWFRIYNVGTSIFITFWNPTTKMFRLMKNGDIENPVIDKINSMVNLISSVSKLKFFSTEIAIQVNGEPIVIDYVNDPIDLRTKSMHADGIPDELLEKMVLSLLDFIKR